jgi:hypothetical protein
LAQRSLWTIDEYTVVADLYVRRGRNSGVDDPEVLELAHLTQRSPASISYRLGNFDGTARSGSGLRPLAGEAKGIFDRMRMDPEYRKVAAEEARSRLAERLRVGSSNQPVLVAPEAFKTESVIVVTPEAARSMRRLEARLVRDYCAWLDPAGLRLKGAVISAATQVLRVDLFDIQEGLLIEAKAAADRDLVRQAVGQLFDYRRYFKPRPSLAILLPEIPPHDLLAFAGDLGIRLIWRHGERFVNSTDISTKGPDFSSRE